MTNGSLPSRLLGITKPISPAVNQVRVMHLLRTHGPLSRADIARYTQLTKATVSRIISDLQSRNLVREIGTGTLSRGRRPVLYAFNTASAVALGVEVRHNECQAVVTELDATPQQRYAYPLPNTHVETVVDVLAEAVAAVRKDFPQPLVGIGIGLPGVIDSERNTVVLAERMEWAEVDLARLVRERLGLDAYLVNRANAAALGEKWYGAGRGRDDLVFINLGTGIRAGVIVDGELYWGANGSAGEIGHTTIVPDGPLCVCGKRGCLEALASTPAMLERARNLAHAGRAASLLERLPHPIEGLTRQEFLVAAHAGDPAALGVLREAAGYIGIGVAHLINLYNPQRIILGGLASPAPAVFLEAIRESAEKHAFDVPWRAVEIVAAELGPDAVAIGAAALLLSGFLQPAPEVFPLP